MTASPEYGNWVTKKIIYTPGVAGLVFLGLGLLLPVFLIPAGLLLSFAAYFAYARYLASPKGGNLQDRIVELVLAHLDWDGEGRVRHRLRKRCSHHKTRPELSKGSCCGD
jgi:hypothetical protein